MIELKTSDYYKVLAPLQSLNINTLFAKAVINQLVPGKVYVDNEKEANAFYIAHPYGMSLLFGEIKNEIFKKDLYNYMINKGDFRNKNEWLQVYPNTWYNVMKNILGTELVTNDSSDNIDSIPKDTHKKVVENTRVNFVFDPTKYENKRLNTLKFEIVKVTKELFNEIQGSVVPKYFWKDELQFENDGVGYSLIYNGEIAATAFSAFRHENQLELGIETSEKYRGKGLAFEVCSALIDYCLENNLEPIWACRKDNVGSYKLAQKLGFVQTISIPYYVLAV